MAIKYDMSADEIRGNFKKIAENAQMLRNMINKTLYGIIPHAIMNQSPDLFNELLSCMAESGKIRQPVVDWILDYLPFIRWSEKNKNFWFDPNAMLSNAQGAIQDIPATPVDIDDTFLEAYVGIIGFALRSVGDWLTKKPKVEKEKAVVTAADLQTKLNKTVKKLEDAAKEAGVAAPTIGTTNSKIPADLLALLEDATPDTWDVILEVLMADTSTHGMILAMIKADAAKAAA